MNVNSSLSIELSAPDFSFFVETFLVSAFFVAAFLGAASFLAAAFFGAAFAGYLLVVSFVAFLAIMLKFYLI